MPSHMSADHEAKSTQTRQERMLRKVSGKYGDEVREEIQSLTSRADFFPALEYFTAALSSGTDPRAIAERTKKPVIALMCLQAPLELFHAFGLHPLKIFSGSHVASRLSAPSVSTLMCPMLRSALGALQLNADSASAGQAMTVDKTFAGWIVPTTCDWVVRFPEMMENCGYNRTKEMFYLELPHLKDNARSQARWLEEIYELRDFLSRLTGKKLERKKLLRSVEIYHRAWQSLTRLTELRRKGKVAGVWYAVITNAFFVCDAEAWTHAVDEALPGFDRTAAQGPSVMLAGSPVYFPNFKVLHNIENAGMSLVADDLCSMERIFPGGIFTNDNSEFGLLQALAQRYHQGCLCPTFAENDRRMANIINPERQKQIKGLIFHVLKGCHSFDISSLTCEQCMKSTPVKYIKIETDYTAEDSQTILTRLEAFHSTLV